MNRSHSRRIPYYGVFALLCTVLLFAAIPAVQGQEGVVWNAEYFNNRFLSAPAALTRQDGAISFNWGTGSPAPEVNSDNFSVRWGADPYFTAGTYRFYVQADDSVRLFVDFPFQPQIDTVNNPAIGQVLTADVTLTEGVHHVQLDYRENTGDAYVYLSWANLATNPSGPNFPVPLPPPLIPSGPWTAQYFPNTNLSGAPFLIQSESSPSGNWGVGSPGANIPVDNWSARWTSVQTLNAGTYQITTRADDGVRVYVDGILYINEWHTATGSTYTTNVNLFAGQHTIQVELYEAGGAAFLDFLFHPIGFPPPVVNPNPPASTTGTVVIAFRLNVRNAPNTDAPILTKINRGETYPVIGRNADSSWWRINVNGTPGWAYWRFLDVANQQLVPVVSADTGESLAQPPPTGITATTLATVNVRSDPGTNNAILGQIARGNQVPVVGRNASNTWWQVNFGQITGWVNSRFAPLQADTVVRGIPVTG